MGASVFQEYVDVVKRWVATLEARVKPALIEEWNPTSFDGHIAISTTNHLFTSVTHAPGAEDHPFHIDVDPSGVLAKAKTVDMIHSEDNIVDYVEETEEDGRIRCVFTTRRAAV
jgi:hypothetical protein